MVKIRKSPGNSGDLVDMFSLRACFRTGLWILGHKLWESICEHTNNYCYMNVVRSVQKQFHYSYNLCLLVMCHHGYRKPFFFSCLNSGTFWCHLISCLALHIDLSFQWAIFSVSILFDLLTMYIHQQINDLWLMKASSNGKVDNWCTASTVSTWVMQK